MRDNIDDVDSKIIHLLKKNGRTPNTELAKKLKISETAIRKRLKRLFENEMIQVVAVVNHRKIGYKLEGNIKIKIDTKPDSNVQISNRNERLDRQSTRVADGCLSGSMLVVQYFLL